MTFAKLLLATGTVLSAAACNSTHMVGSVDGGMTAGLGGGGAGGQGPGGAGGPVGGLALSGGFAGSGGGAGQGATNKALSACGVLGFGFVGAVAFSPDEKVIAVAAPDVVVLLDRQTGRHLHRLIASSDRTSLAFSPDGALLVAGGTDRIHVWRVADGQEALSMPLAGQVDVAYSPDGRKLAAAANGTLVVYAMPAGTELWRADWYSQPVFARDNTFLLALEGGRIPVLLDPWVGTPLRSLDEADWTDEIAVSSKGLIATSGTGESLRLWRSSDGSLVRSLGGNSPYLLQFSGDGSLLVVSDGSEITLIRVDDGVLLGSFNVPVPPLPSSLGIFYTSPIALSKDARALVFGAPDATVHVADLSQPPARGQPVTELSRYAWGHTGRVNDAAFSPDGRLVASGSDDGNVIVWDAASGEPVAVLPHGAAVQRLFFAPDGTRLFSLTGTVFAWNLADPNAAPLTAPSSGFVLLMDMSRDGTLLATSGWYNEIVVRRSSDLAPILTIPLPAMTGEPLIFSPDGSQLITTVTAGKLAVIRIADGSTVLEHDQAGPMRLAAFGLGDTRLVESGTGIKLLSWPQLQDLPGFAGLASNGSLNAIALSPSGAQAIAGGMVWRLDDGAPIASLEIDGHPFWPTMLRFPPGDASRLLSTTQSGVRIYCRAADDGLPLQ